ncbi:hypothetical protein HYV31_01530 [candidate division WWE3 bacterium]|nr:hypothetical protein [candidate division WWE3 bacterium]
MFLKPKFILATFLFGAVVVLIFNHTKNDTMKDATVGSPETNHQENRYTQGCVSNAKPVFTHYITDLSKIEKIAPLGGVSGGSPGRSYLTIKEGKVPIYAPADAVLQTIVYARRGGDKTPGEYGLYFSLTCDVYFLIDHIDEVTEKLQKLAPESPSLSSATQFGTNPNIKISAGELLGFSDGTPMAHTFDFLVEDKNNVAFHINPKRWTWDQTTKAVCPYNYYDKDKKTTYLQLIREKGSNNTDYIYSDCGSPSQDVAGTVLGGWFQGDSTNTKGNWLAIGKMFNWVEVTIRRDLNFSFSLKEYDTKITPDMLKVGQETCYQGYGNNWIWLRLVTDNKLESVIGTGMCPAEFPNVGVEYWER